MPLRDHKYDGDDDEKQVKAKDLKFTEFDCPGCNANNPVEPPFGHHSEVLCNYCGMEWQVRVNDEGQLDLKEL
jgi:transcription elongation factor Elf1